MANGQSANEQGTDLRTIANQIEGILDDDGHYNPNPGQVSRGHPDYDESTDNRAQQPQRDDRGRFKAKAKAPAQEQQPEIDDNADVDQLPDGDDLDEDTGQYADGDTDENLTDSADETPDQHDDETGTIQTLADLAEALEMPLEELAGQITHSFKAADDDVTVTLAELTSGYQKDADYRRSTAKLAEERRALETEHSLRMRSFQQENESMAQQLNAIEGIFMQQLNDPQLEQLRHSNPAEWTARREEIGMQVNQLRQVRQQAAQRYAAVMEQSLTELRDRELKAVRDAMPDFSDKDADTARETMTTLGYSEPEIAQMFDHRILLGALELNRLRAENATLKAEKEKARDTVKRIKKDVPKLTKPGKQRLRTNQGIARDRVQKLRQKAKKSGSVQDAAAVIETMI